MDGFLAAAIGVIAAVTLTPVVRRIAIARNIVDRPGNLKTHTTPVAYLGGVAVFLAASGGPLLAGRPVLLIPMGLALGLGLADDLRPLPVPLRVGIEMGIAVVAGSSVPGSLLIRIATAVLVLGLLNAVNLLDGQDGLASGVGAVAAIGLAALGGSATAVGLGLAGALGGFLVYNRPPARIYLGDAGAYFVGTTLALLPALSRNAETRWSIWWAVPVLVAVPVADTAIAITRRLRAGHALLSGDRSHVYDQLVDRGMTVTRSTVIFIGAQCLLSAIGLGAAQTSGAIALLITAVVALGLGAVAWRIGLLTTQVVPNPGDS